MAARRLLILMLVLLVVSTVAAALVPQRERSDETDTRTTTTATEPKPRGEERAAQGRLVRRTVDVSPHGAEPVPLRLGDELALVVRAGVADQIEIPAFGRIEDIGPDDPARFDLLPDRTGTFEVRMLGARRAIARIRVRPARREREKPASDPSASPRG